MATAAPLSGTQNLSRPALLMTTASAGLRLKLLLFTAHFRSLRTFPSNLSNVHGLSCTGKRHLLDGPAGARVRATASASQLKDEWLDSLSCPFSERIGPPIARDELHGAPDSGWVLGIDPDVSGALALLKADGSAQVFDTPHLQVLVGKRIRKRLDTRSIVQLLHGCGAPLGTTAYIEQSTPFPKDGKQGWWSGGYTYGLWIGILVASGYSVVPVSSRLWKDHFELSRNPSSKVIRTKAEEFFEGSKANSFCTKDDSREAASNLFPSLSSQLKRKKDHGRAEALLIAAYGKGLRIQSDLIAT